MNFSFPFSIGADVYSAWSICTGCYLLIRQLLKNRRNHKKAHLVELSSISPPAVASAIRQRRKRIDPAAAGTAGWISIGKFLLLRPNDGRGKKKGMDRWKSFDIRQS